MGNNIHRFAHTCADGTALTLDVDISGKKPKFKSNLAMQTRPDLSAEYQAWVEVVCQTIIPLLSVDQLHYCGIVGVEKWKAQNANKTNKSAGGR